MDEDFYSRHGSSFHNQQPQSTEECLALLTSSPSITYLCNNSTTIRLKSASGPQTEFTVFGSPYSPRHGHWAFYYDSPDTSSTPSDDFPEPTSSPPPWGLIPLDTDIVVTHTPPRMHCDRTDETRPAGCEALRQSLWRVRPKLAVCGHVHDGRGSERVVWDLDHPYEEESVTVWEDPGADNSKNSKSNNKLSIVDLTGKKQPALANDGSHPRRSSSPRAEQSSTNTNHHHHMMMTASSGTQRRDMTAPAATVAATATTAGHSVIAAQVLANHGTSAGIGTDSGSSSRETCHDHKIPEDNPERASRRETCIVNAAIMKSRYPHKEGKTFNKPIVVDINLPVWRESILKGT